ncbi:MAG: nucleotidyltransferase domain-containing protein [Candidatus Caldatribacteriaceae bacterium]
MVAEENALFEVIMRYLNRLRQEIRVTRAILFGSHALGEALNTSDVDLVILSPDFRGMNFLRRLELLARYWEPGLDADILGYTPEEFEEASQKLTFLSEVKKTGQDITPP